MLTIDQAIKKANDLHASKHYLEAEKLYEQLIAFKPDDPLLIYLLGTLYLETEKTALAQQLLLRAMDVAHEKNLNMPFIANNLGIVLKRLGFEEKAEKAYEYALEMMPGDKDPLVNLSGVYINNGTPEKAVEFCDRALDKFPDEARVLKHKGLALLEAGDYEQAWKFYKARWSLNEMECTKRPVKVPEWDGKQVNRLAIHGEQGLGDEILFMSYFSKVKPLAKEIRIESAKRLTKLFARSFGVPCVSNFSDVGEIDAYVPMGNMPCYVGPLPDGKPFLKADPERVEFYRSELLKVGKPPYVGISWKGGTVRTHAHLRVSTLETWKQYVMKPGLTYVSVQYGNAQAEADSLGIPHWPEVIADIDELAALIQALGHVVSVCNTSIHIAGGLGVPCWVMTPSKPAWRYGMKGESVPWYSSVKLYRQNPNENWERVYKQIGADLEAKASLGE